MHSPVKMLNPYYWLPQSFVNCISSRLRQNNKVEGQNNILHTLRKASRGGEKAIVIDNTFRQLRLQQIFNCQPKPNFLKKSCMYVLMFSLVIKASSISCWKFEMNTMMISILSWTFIFIKKMLINNHYRYKNKHKKSNTDCAFALYMDSIYM